MLIMACTMMVVTLVFIAWALWFNINHIEEDEENDDK